MQTKIARVYLRVSTDAQDLQRQEAIAEQARAAGYYVAGVYREKASGAPDRPDQPPTLARSGGADCGHTGQGGAFGGAWGA